MVVWLLEQLKAERIRIVAVVRGEIYKHHYRKWPQIGDGDRSHEHDITRHCDALANWLEEHP